MNGATTPTPADFEDLFARRIESYYTENRNAYRVDKMENGKLRAKLREANSAFLKSRRTDTSLEERERALQKLETGYLKFLEIAQNLDEGRKFYNDIAKMLQRWRDEIRGYVYQRKKEARDLEGYEQSVSGLIFSNITGQMAALKLSDTDSIESERRSSQRITRSANRQSRESNGNGSATKPDGNAKGGMWTPGTPPTQPTNIKRPRNPIRLVNIPL